MADGIQNKDVVEHRYLPAFELSFTANFTDRSINQYRTPKTKRMSIGPRRANKMPIWMRPTGEIEKHPHLDRFVNYGMARPLQSNRVGLLCFGRERNGPMSIFGAWN